MHIAADIFIGAFRTKTAILAAASRAFGVPAHRVAMRGPGDIAWPAADVVFEYFEYPIIGDYPGQFVPWIPESIVLPSALSALSQFLAAPVLTADDERYEFANLYLPDGSMHDVLVDQDDDGGIRNSPEMRRLIERAAPSSAVAS